MCFVFTEKYDKTRKESVDLSRVAKIRCGVRNATNMPGRKHLPEAAASNRRFHTIWLSESVAGVRARMQAQACEAAERRLLDSQRARLWDPADPADPAGFLRT